MNDFTQQMWKRQGQASDLVKVAKFIPVEKESAYSDPNLKVYDVVVGSGSSRVVLGRVEQVPHTSYRMCGNLVSRSYDMVEWAPAYVPGEKSYGLTHRTRKVAAEHMVENFLRRQA
jgi:hypothetical protein